jgi:hypothetical protein
MRGIEIDGVQPNQAAAAAAAAAVAEAADV